MILGKSALLRKIDPELMKPMRAMSNEKVGVIIYSRADCRGNCKEKLEKLGVQVKYNLPLIDGYAFDVPYNQLMDLASLRDVKYIASDISVKTLMHIASRTVGTDKISNLGLTGKGIGIAFIDTGIYPHPDFLSPKNRIVAFKDFVKGKELPYDDNGHGTFVAGVAAGNGYSSRGKYRGIAPEANIIALKSMDREGGGSASDILAAMQWIADHQKEYNIRVLSLSLGTEVKRISSNDPLVRGVEALWEKGITVVVAAGNSGPKSGTITSPGISSKVITVGALDDKRTPSIDDDTIAKFSSRGPVGRMHKPDVVAPGVDIVSVKSDVEYEAGARIRPMATSYTTMSGTSMATPIVGGAAVLMLEKHPDWKPDQIKEALLKNATSIVKDPDAEGRGLINLEKCLK